MSADGADIEHFCSILARARVTAFLENARSLKASAAQLFAEGTRYSVAARSFLSSSESASLALQALGTCSPQRSAGVGDEARNYDLLLLAASSASNASLAFGKAECWRLAAQAAQSCIESLTAAAATATDSGAIAAHPPPISASQRQSLSSGSFPSRVRPSASRRASSREPLLPRCRCRG